MSAPQVRPTVSPLDFVFEVIDFVTGLGILVMSMSPFAIPGIVLVVVPLIALGLVGGLAAAVLAVPVLLVRGVTASLRRSRTGSEDDVRYVLSPNAPSTLGS